MARVFGDLELQYVKEVLDSGQLGWAEGRMVTRLEHAFAAKSAPGSASPATRR